MLKVTLQKLKNTELIFWLCIGLKKKQTQHRVEGFGANKEKRTTNSKETRAGVAVNSKKSQPQAKLHLGHEPFLL